MNDTDLTYYYYIEGESIVWAVDKEYRADWLEQINNLKYFTSSKDYSQYDVNYLYIIFNEDGEPTDVGIQIEGVKNKRERS